MKNIILSLLALSAVIGADAQEALWGGQQIISPEVGSDGRVTFRFLAPTADKVEVTGDFLPTQRIDTPYGTFDAPGVAAMTRSEQGIWEYTSEPLPSELYNYSVIVDGLRTTDPNNVYLVRDIASLTNIFIVGGERGDMYSVRDVARAAGTPRPSWAWSVA